MSTVSAHGVQQSVDKVCQYCVKQQHYRVTNKQGIGFFLTYHSTNNTNNTKDDH